MIEEYRYFADDNNSYGYYDDEEFDITGFFQSNMNKVYILLEVGFKPGKKNGKIIARYLKIPVHSHHKYKVLMVVSAFRYFFF